MGFHIAPEDEQLHPPLDSPQWRESFWLDAHDAANNLSLVIYAHARPSVGQGDIFLCIDGRDTGHIEYDQQNLPYSGPHRGTTACVGTLRHTFEQPSQAVSFSLAVPQVTLDLQFASMGPVYDYDWEMWTASRHVEQFGAIRGVLRTPDREIAFEGFGTRDHAWGARAKVPWRRWMWITARFASCRGWSACIVDADRPLLLGYVSGATYEEATSALFRFHRPHGALASAEIELQSPNSRTRARILPRVTMPRSGTDPTKGGTYFYYFVDVDDEKFGRGHGLLNVYTTPGHDLRDCDVMSCGAP